MTEEREKPPRRAARYSKLRKATVAAVLVVATVGFVWHTGTGTLSSFGWGDIALLCPLGALEALVGGWAFVPRAAIAFAVVVAIVLVFGRSFCAWVCPVPSLRGFFTSKKASKKAADERAEAGRFARENYEGGSSVKRTPAGVDSRHIVLCGALGTTAVFGFPVFCLVCPIGLTFAIMIGVVRLVGYNEPSLSLLLFAAILAVELVFLRRWCHKICPLGALMSLISQANRTFRPSVDAEKCLRSSSCDACGACASRCPEHIDPHSDLGLRGLAECTRCGLCAEACPEQAISFPLLRAGASNPASATEPELSE